MLSTKHFSFYDGNQSLTGSHGVLNTISFLLKWHWPWQYMVNIFSTQFIYILYIYIMYIFPTHFSACFKWQGCLPQLVKSLTAVNTTQPSSLFSDYWNNDSGREREVKQMDFKSYTEGGGQLRVLLKIFFSFMVYVCDTILKKKKKRWCGQSKASFYQTSANTSAF